MKKMFTKVSGAVLENRNNIVNSPLLCLKISSDFLLEINPANPSPITYFVKFVKKELTGPRVFIKRSNLRKIVKKFVI